MFRLNNVGTRTDPCKRLFSHFSPANIVIGVNIEKAIHMNMFLRKHFEKFYCKYLYPVGIICYYQVNEVDCHGLKPSLIKLLKERTWSVELRGYESLKTV